MFSIRHVDDSFDDVRNDSVVVQLEALYDELRSATREHGDVSITNEESGVCISAHRDGSVVMGSLFEASDRHLSSMGKDGVIEVWRHFIDGDSAWLERQPWKQGYSE